MPIYAYACTACGHHYDRLQKLSEPDPVACPECGVDAVKRQITAPSFRLSGSGWYETDFKKDGDNKRNLVEKAEGAKGETSAAESSQSAEKKAEPRTEAKPDPKPEAKSDSKRDSKPDSKPAKVEPAAKPATGSTSS